MDNRRGFLRGLVTLPLIGGGVTLIGQPTAAAVTVTDAVQERYLAWLAYEHRAAVREHRFRRSLASWCPHPDSCENSAIEYARRVEADGPIDYMLWYPDTPDIARAVAEAPSSSRAAVILSAAGVPLASDVRQT